MVSWLYTGVMKTYLSFVCNIWKPASSKVTVKSRLDKIKYVTYQGPEEHSLKRNSYAESESLVGVSNGREKVKVDIPWGTCQSLLTG